MILMEEFKEFLSENLKMYLDKKRVDNDYEMASLAEEYVLMHKWGKSSCGNSLEFGSGPNARDGLITGLNSKLS